MNDIVPAGGFLLIALIVSTGLGLSRSHPRAPKVSLIMALALIGVFLIAYLLGARYA